MDKVRGILMLFVGAFAFYRGIIMHTRQSAWLAIGLGLVAIAIALFARRGLWGLVDEHLGVRLFPVGYYLWPSGSRNGRNGGKGRNGRKPAKQAA